ncbi:MAG: kinase [Alistipes sp.]
MEHFGKIVAVTIDDLTRSDDGEAVMSRSCYDKLATRQRINILRPGKGLGSCALIEYTSLPERFRLKFEAKYGNPEDILRPKTMNIKLNAAARCYFSGGDEQAYLLPSGERLTIEKAEEYTLNASVLDVLLALVNDQKADRHRLKNRTPIAWEGIFAQAELLRAEYHHTLPASATRLRDKLRQYVTEGFDCLVSKKFGNSNTLKITEAGGRQIIALRRSRVPVYTLTQIFEEYNRIAEQKNWKPLRSENALKMYLNRPEVMPRWVDAVRGELAAKQLFERKQRTSLPLLRDALWYGDGTKLNLYYKGRDKDGNLVKMTTQVYEVIDAYSEMLLGHCIAPTENFAAQRTAFRQAVERAGHKPYEIVTDNQGGARKTVSKEFISRLCRVARPTAPHQPQAKSIEALFGRFQGQVLHRDWRFTGGNITDKSPESRPNMEFIEANADQLYTYEELCAAYAQYREVWNEMPHPRTGISRREMYRTSVNAQAPELTTIDLMEMFWLETKEPSTFTGSGITITVDNISYTYEVYDAQGLPDMAFRASNTTRKFYVRYDPDDMSIVRLCTKTATGTRIVAEARPYALRPRAIQEQSSEDVDFYRTTIELNKQERIRRQMENYSLEVEHGVAAEQHGLRSPQLRGLSKRDAERLSDQYLMQVVPIATAAPRGDDHCEPITVGQVEKQVSNMTFDQVSFLSKF